MSRKHEVASRKVKTERDAVRRGKLLAAAEILDTPVDDEWVGAAISDALDLIYRGDPQKGASRDRLLFVLGGIFYHAPESIAKAALIIAREHGADVAGLLEGE